MFGKKEKWEERNGRGEKWRENEKLGCLVGEKNGEKRKVVGEKKYVGSTKNEFPSNWREKVRENLASFKLIKLTLKLASLILYEYTLIYIYIWLCLKSMMSFEVIGLSLKI